MKPLVTAVTLGVRDVRASRDFYVEGLGWQPLFAEEGEILFLQIAHGQLLALWNAKSMRREYGDVGHHRSGPAVPVSLGQNVDSPEEVDEVAGRRSPPAPRPSRRRAISRGEAAAGVSRTRTATAGTSSSTPASASAATARSAWARPPERQRAASCPAGPAAG